ncbi:MAG: hypothetical protein RL748_642 [Pseudomonadota bacterium]|jgi:GNAT superfamily N-acetyltransferase
MPNLHYRTATAADIPAMSVIRLAVQENKLSNPARITQQDYQDHLAEKGQSWVAELDGTIIGFSSAANDGSIWALFVDPAREGLGAGRQLLALAVQYLFASGHEKIILSTGANTRADRVYQAAGWQRGAMLNAVEVAYSLSRPRLDS